MKNTPVGVKTLGFLTISAVALSGCVRQEQAEDLGDAMGNAIPVASATTADPAGTVIDYAAIQDIQLVDDVVAIRSLEDGTSTAQIDFYDASQLASATSSADLEAALLETQYVADSCHDLIGHAGTFTLACEDTVVFFPASDLADATTLPVSTTATSAVLLNSGELITANTTDSSVEVLSNWTAKKTDAAVYTFEDADYDYDVVSIRTERPTHQLLAVARDGEPDAVIRINREYTLIQDIQWWDEQAGGILRLGQGVGQIAGGPDGMVLAADSIGNQAGLYGTDEIIRLHQMSPVPNGPWDVAWDAKNDWAWVSSTGAAKLTGYAVNTGTFVEQEQYDAVADAQNFVVLADGTLIVGSASAAGLQIIQQ